MSHIPVFVRAGSIVPLGPVKPYADAPSDEPIQLRVYPGASGTFSLYDDAGDGFGYEKGDYSLVQLAWNDRSRTLSLAAREGSYASTPRFRIICGAAPSATRELSYTGVAVKLRLPGCR